MRAATGSAWLYLAEDDVRFMGPAVKEWMMRLWISIASPERKTYASP